MATGAQIYGMPSFKITNVHIPKTSTSSKTNIYVTCDYIQKSKIYDWGT